MAGRRKVSFRARVAFGVVSLLIYGCEGVQLYEPHRVERQDQAGVVNLAVTLVAPWEDYVAALKPKFELTAEKALDKVIPRTTTLDERFFDALAAKARVGLPQTSVAKSERESSMDGAASTSSERTETRQPGQLPPESAIPAVPERDPSKLVGLADKDRALHEEPMLEYTAAAALFQEVQLLNRYVEDAAQRYSYRPYIVRMQIAVFPYARNQPYDLYSTFAFYPSCKSSEKGYAAVVVPLLVTDNLEGTLKSRTTDTIRQLSLALSFLVQGVVGEAGLKSLREELRSIVGTDINSLMTVSRRTDNTIYVRLGAARQPTAGYAMIPRTHAITFLLMVDEKIAECEQQRGQIKVIAKTVLRDAMNGKELPVRDRELEYADIAKVLRTYHPEWRVDARECRAALKEEKVRDAETMPAAKLEKAFHDRLLSKVFKNDYDSFYKILHDCEFKTLLARELWLQIVEITERREFTGAGFDLPRPSPFEPPKDQAQSILLLDDGKTSMTARLQGGSGIVPGRTSARLTLKLKTDKELPFMATSISMGSEAGGRNPIFVFPSVAALKVADLKLGGYRLEGSMLEVFCVPGRWDSQAARSKCNDKREYKNLYYLKQPTEPLPEPPAFSLRVGTESMVADKAGNGRLKLFVKFEKEDDQAIIDTVEITVGNADVEKVEAEPLGKASLSQGKITVSGDAAVILTLRNLVEGKKLDIKAIGKKGKKTVGSSPSVPAVTVHKGSG